MVNYEFRGEVVKNMLHAAQSNIELWESSENTYLNMHLITLIQKKK